MTNYNDGIAFTDTFTNYSEDGSFDIVTVAVNKSGISGMVVCFDASTASYRISDPIFVPRMNGSYDLIFVNAVRSFVGSYDITHDIWGYVVRLEAEYRNAIVAG